MCVCVCARARERVPFLFLSCFLLLLVFVFFLSFFVELIFGLRRVVDNTTNICFGSKMSPYNSIDRNILVCFSFRATAL